MNYQQIAEYATHLAHKASEATQYVRKTNLQAQKKKDGSTVTNGDLASERIIVEGLRQQFPDIPVVSEEEYSQNPQFVKHERFWLIDPIDSTSAYVRGSDEYAICMGLVENNKPVLGVIAAPALNTVHVGIVPEMISYCIDTQGIRSITQTRLRDPRSMVAVESPASARVTIPGDNITYVSVHSAIKFTWVAQGMADIYARRDWLSEWDIAAGDAIVIAAGGTFTDHQGNTILYGNPGFLASPFVAQGRV
jgi:3'(2'), 5'-bisphosphate nucleotidase